MRNFTWFRQRQIYIVNRQLNLKQRLGKLGLTIEDLGQVPGGEIAIAAIVPEAGRLATVLLVDTTGHEEETKQLLDEIERYDRPSGFWLSPSIGR